MFWVLDFREEYCEFSIGCSCLDIYFGSMTRNLIAWMCSCKLHWSSSQSYGTSLCTTRSRWISAFGNPWHAFFCDLGSPSSLWRFLFANPHHYIFLASIPILINHLEILFYELLDQVCFPLNRLFKILRYNIIYF